jgi:hypothetical protein
MKGKLLTLGVLVCVISLLPGCGLVTPGSITGSGNIVTQAVDYLVESGFDKLDVSDGFTVNIRQSGGYGVVIRIDDNLEKYLEVAKKGSTLNIGLKPSRPSTLKNATLQADVTMPELTGLDMSGGSHCTASGFESPRALRFELSGGSGVTFSGSAGDVTIDASGGSQVDLATFVAANADVEASSGSQVTVNVTGRLDADASSGSMVYYVGSPTLGTIDESSDAEVRRK